MNRIGIVICSRLASSRLPNKAHLLLENKTVISHLVDNIRSLNIPIVVTVPRTDFQTYLLDESMPRFQNLLIHASDHDEDPLARTAQVAKQFEFDVIIRITHDKIFIDTEALKEAINVFKKEKADYLYASNLIPGTNFEIMNYRVLFAASLKFKNVEYISYAVREVSSKIINFTYNQTDYVFDGLNMLLDYEDDYKFFQVIYSRLGEQARLRSVLDFLNKNKHIVYINRKPVVSIYTCAYNATKYLEKAIDSVVEQSIFNSCEYILIDDHSNDDTFEIMAKAGVSFNNISYYRNNKNLGLASSSNIALSKARGKYIMRLDSDDYFTSTNAVKDMLEHARYASVEALYPDNYFGDVNKIQKGREMHHVGCALFSKAALNFIKFTDGLRGHEGYDLFLRTKHRLKIGYYEKPIFFYTQHQNSLSKQNKNYRDSIKKEIEVRIKNGSQV